MEQSILTLRGKVFKHRSMITLSHMFVICLSYNGIRSITHRMISEWWLIGWSIDDCRFGLKTDARNAARFRKPPSRRVRARRPAAVVVGLGMEELEVLRTVKQQLTRLVQRHWNGLHQSRPGPPRRLRRSVGRASTASRRRTRCDDRRAPHRRHYTITTTIIIIISKEPAAIRHLISRIASNSRRLHRHV